MPEHGRCTECGGPKCVICGKARSPRKGRVYCSRQCFAATRAVKAAARFWSKVDKTPGRGPWGDCWVWMACRNKLGYGMIGVMGGRNMLAHRLSYMISKDGIIDGDVVRHRCDNPPCVNPSHLMPGTHADNSDDRVSRGRQNKGTAVRTAKLTPALVRRIRKHLGEGASQRGVAKIFNVSSSAIAQIASRKNWAHVLDNEPDDPPRPTEGNDRDPLPLR